MRFPVSLDLPRLAGRLARCNRSRTLLLLCAALVGAAGAPPAWAQGSVPYMPGAAARQAIQWLVDEAGLGLTTSQWPLPAAAVEAALAGLPGQLSPDEQAAREFVRADLRRSREAAAVVTVARRAPALVGYGDDAVPGSALALKSPLWRLGVAEGAAEGAAPDGAAPDRRNETADAAVEAAVESRLGLRVEAAPVLGAVPPGTTSTGAVQLRLEDSAVAAGWGGAVLQAWSRRSWWGPGWQSSLVLGNNAPAMLGLGIQRAAGGRSASPWLSWLGPWNAEFFVARLDGVASPAHPWLIGNRITLAPWSGVELGLTRTAQWGGEGRSQSLRSFVSMLAGSGTNADTAAQRERDPGNQMAGLDLRLRCPMGLRCAGYGQFIGEDAGGMWPSKFLYLLGAEAWSANGTQRWGVEYLHSSCGAASADGTLGCAYRNGQYPEGYAHERRWLGAGVGPDARMLSLAWTHAPTGHRLRLHGAQGRGLAQADAAGQPGAVFAFTAGAPRTRLRAVQWQRDWSFAGGVLTPQLGWQRVSGGGWSDHAVQAGAQWRVDLDAVAGAWGAGR